MKKILPVILLLLSVTVLWSAEKSRVALVAYDPSLRDLADLALAQLSGQFDFVERQEVGKIQQEVKTADAFFRERTAQKMQVTGADLYGCLEKGPDNRPVITIFETDSGIRLVQQTLASENARAAGAIGQLLQSAAAKNQAPDEVRMISVAAVRYNMPPSLQSRAEAFAGRLQQVISDSNVIILERDYLVELARENRLSGKWEKAVAASEIMHIEFNLGAKPDFFVVAVYLSDVTNRKTFTFEASERDPEVIKKFAAALAQTFAEPRPEVGYNFKNEAARFAREGDFLRPDRSKFWEAQDKYLTAFILDPYAPTYLSQIHYPRHNRPETVNRFFPHFEICVKKIMDNQYLLKKTEIANQLLLFFHEVDIDRAYLSADNQILYRQIMEDNRAAMISRLSVADSVWLAKIKGFDYTRREFYWDQKQFVQDKKTAAASLIEVLAKPPLPQSKMAQTQYSRAVKYFIYQQADDFFELQDSMPRNELAAWTEDYAANLEAIKRPELLPLSALLRANALMYQSSYTDDAAFELIRQYMVAEQAKLVGEGALNLWPKLQRFVELKQKVDEFKAAKGKP